MVVILVQKSHFVKPILQIIYEFTSVKLRNETTKFTDSQKNLIIRAVQKNTAARSCLFVVSNFFAVNNAAR